MKTIRVSAVLAVVILLAPYGRAQCQIQKLVASDAQPQDDFGYSVAISGDWAAIGAPFTDDIASQSGAVYIFQRVGSTWTQTQKLKASDAAFGSIFGECVAMSGATLVVGASGDSPQGISAAGAAYVFELSGSVWTQTAKLIAGDPDSGDGFGSRVANTGDRLLVAASSDDERAFDAGAVYVFDRGVPAWVQTVKLMGSDSAPFDDFAIVCLQGDRALIGAPSKAGQAGPQVGAAYVFDKGPSGWTETQKLLPSDGLANNHFGFAVALMDNHAIVGAPSSNHFVSAGGAIYAFENTGSGWTQNQEFCTDDVGGTDQLGGALAAGGGHAVADSNAAGAGSAYDFRLSGSSWSQAGKMLARDAAVSDGLGAAIAISGDTVLLGAPGVDDACTNDPNCESGAVYVFQLAPTATQYGHCPSGAPCNNIDKHGGCRNSTGEGAILAACGSGGAVSDDLQLQATHCPANKSTLLFMGGTQVQAPFADGIRVVGGGAPGIYRFGIIQSDATGTAIRGPGLVAQSQGFHSNGRIQAGQVWNFQVWYRDLTGPCHHLTNYSNGVQVAFTP